MTNDLGIALRPDQWHLLNQGQTGGTPGIDINVLGAWGDYRGEGIKIVVFDTGVDTTHPDLVGNYLAEFGFEFTTDTPDGAFQTALDGYPHGTFVSGFISADGADSGVLGVAFESKFTSYANFNGQHFVEAFRMAADNGFDVINNSWGPSIPFALTFRSNPEFEQAMLDAVATGRDGLGLNIVFAAGNAYTVPPFLRELGFEWSGDLPYADVNTDSAQAARYTITVAAIDHNGTYSAHGDDPGFTTPGAPVLISAPGANVVSTDIAGEDGYNPGENFAASYGTSFAAPIVSGVVALMLEANPLLGYRDVQEILVYSARLNHLEDESWHLNGAVDSNGGGLWVNDNYGFGMVDATAAVRLAETWTKQNTFANEEVIGVVGDIDATAIPDDGSVEFTITLEDGIRIENIELDFDITHAEFGDLVISLISPSGTESILLYRAGDGRATEIYKILAEADGEVFEPEAFANLQHTLTSNDFWGEASGGDWTLRVSDAREGNTGAVNAFALRAYGATETVDRTFIYTDDFALLAEFEPERTVLDDAVGAHTLNFAAISGAVAINLAEGRGEVAGTALSISGATTIDTVYTGDGADTITLSEATATVFAGRGDDTVIAASADAAIDGGAGWDRVVLTEAREAYEVVLQEAGITLANTAAGYEIATSSVQYFAFGAEPDAALIVLGSALEAQLAKFYDLLLGRTAEYEGLGHWIGVLAATGDVAAIASAFAHSAEFSGLGADLSDQAYLDLLYQQIFGRDADTDGAAFWLERIDAMDTRTDIAVDFVLSGEAMAMAFDHIMIVGAADAAIA